MAETWWWDLTRGRAVTSDRRPRDVEALGPYPSRAAAEAWRETAEARNEAWDQADEEWEQPDDDAPGDDAPGQGGPGADPGS